MSKTYSKTRILVECALMIAIGTVLSNIKIFTMPNGGICVGRWQYWRSPMRPITHGKRDILPFKSQLSHSLFRYFASSTASTCHENRSI